jgi:signal transduction histidine kinase
MRRLGWFAAWPAGLVFGAAAVLFARSDPSYAFAVSGLAIAAELVAGYALIASGLILMRHRARRRVGTLLLAGGCGWFLLEWNNPGVGSSLVFTTGLVLYATAPPLLAHGLLTYQSHPLRFAGRAAIVAAYSGSLLILGVLAALVYDPVAQGCSQCPHNLLLLDASASLYEQLNRVGVYLGLSWSLLVLALIVWRLVRSTAATRVRLAPVLAAGSAYMCLVAADFAVSVHRGYLNNDLIDRRLWSGEAAALVLLALALAWSWLRGRRIRAKLARLVVELSAAPSAGDLETALALSLGDPGLRLAYPLADGRYVDGEGREVDPGHTSTALVREGVEVALLTHKAGLLDDPGLGEALAATVRLALDHARLRAELLAHLADLRSSRVRIVATGDRERQRLERDLHDGAQQRLVALTLALALLRAQLQAQPDHDRLLLARVEQADRELRSALDDLRTLATGIFPAVLADEGLCAAIEALAEEQPGRIHINSLPESRLDPIVESAAYRVIAETIKHAGRNPVSLAAHADGGLLTVELESDGLPADLTNLEDRLGALNGTISLKRASPGHARIHAEIPCAS